MKTSLAGFLKGLPALALVGLPAVLQLHAQPVNLLAYWDFNDASNPAATFDQVYGLPGFLVSGAAYGADGSGATGAAGDLAMDFGITSAGQLVRVTDAPWFDIAVKSATDRDQLTVTFWQKLHAVASTTSVWFQSPSSSGTQRGFQAHVSWGDNNVYFDTAGCCTVPNQRLSAGISSLPTYYDGFLLDYHHIALVKDGADKRVYIDGILFMTNSGVDAFPSDFVQLTIGAAFDASNSLQGMIDEFAVFAGALGETAITALAGGAAPDELPGIEIIPPVGPPTITQDPADATVMVGDTVSFSITVSDDAFPGPRFQWAKNGEDIPGAVDPDYTIDRAGAADDGAEFTCTVGNAGGSATSAPATLTVDADTVAPLLADAWGNLGFDRVTVQFSEPVDPATGEVAGNYQLSGGVTVSAAVLAAPSGTAGDHRVILTTSTQPEGAELTLTVNNVEDLQGNPVAADSQVTFGTYTYLPDAVSWERWNGGISIANLYALVTDPNHRAPDVSWLTSILESGRGLADSYGARGYAWFTPATTGDYEFLLTCDDNGRALLSTDADPANLLGIAAESGWSNARTWAEASASEQYSYSGYPYWTDPLGIVPFSAWGQITLNANQKYFLEVLWQEGGGGDGAELTIIKSGDAIPADNTPADAAGGELGTYYDPNTVLGFVTQPTDQVGAPSSGLGVYAEDFSGGDGGFTVVNEGTPPGPWAFDSANGQWVANNGNDACGDPNNSQLSSPAITVPETGVVTLSFQHRYSFESDLWDAGIVRISVNGGAFTYLPAAAFTVNGYAAGVIQGNGIANGLGGFNANSPGYADGVMITTQATLGTFNAGDTVAVQFVGAWDECATGSIPNWVLGSVSVEMFPLLQQDFTDGDGAFYVVNSDPAPPGPWEYDGGLGQWLGRTGNDACGTPNHSLLNSPAYMVAATGEVVLSFTHRYAFEGDLWDAGQLRMSLNGGPYETVPAEAFTANGYTEGALIGNHILLGQRGFNGESAGYQAGTMITSVATLGTFNAGTMISLQFACGWDECSTGTVPNWVLGNVMSDQLVFGNAALETVFSAVAEATLHGDPVAVSYQWQRDDGAGFADIPGATSADYSIYPLPADFDAMFRVVATTPSRDPNKQAISNEVKLITGEVEAPTIGISATGGTVTVTFTGTLQSAEAVEGPYADVAGAESPYTVPAGAAAGFYRSMK